MINRIDIVSIPVSNQATSKAFYMEKLGFDLLRENPMGPEQTWVELTPRGAQTSITLTTWFPAMPPGSVQGIVLDTNDIDTTHAELESRGLAISQISEAPWGRFATFSDPDGNGWVLQQTPGGVR